MTTHFDAQVITVSAEESYAMVGFADHPFDTHAYILLQRASAFDEQDCALGMDTVYLERDDQRQSHYGGIDHILLTPILVRLTLSAATAHALGSERELGIAIAPSPVELRRLRDSLHQLCAELVPLTIDGAVDRLLASER